MKQAIPRRHRKTTVSDPANSFVVMLWCRLNRHLSIKPLLDVQTNVLLKDNTTPAEQSSFYTKLIIGKTPVKLASNPPLKTFFLNAYATIDRNFS
jgi:hypothetical protein